MTSEEYLRKLKYRYLLIRSAEILLWALAGGFIAFGLIVLGAVTGPMQILIPLMVAGAISITMISRLRLAGLKEDRLAAFISRNYTAMNASTDLLTRNAAELTGLQQLQKRRAAETLESLYPAIRLPHRLGAAALLLAVSAAIVLALLSFPEKMPARIAEDKKSIETGLKQRKLPAAIRTIDIRVSPPAYTKTPSFTTTDPRLEIPEGSRVAWTIRFTDSVRLARAVFSGRDSLALRSNGLHHVLQRSFTADDFYQLAWSTESGWQGSDFYRIGVVRDLPPEINVLQLSQYTQLSVDDRLAVDVTCILKDDYGLKGAHVIATVSKGDGESVKFREEKLAFPEPAADPGRSWRASRTVDLARLGVEPGDELYFYIEAWDNKEPRANRSRTETFFIALKDTSDHSLSVESGLGVDLMPEYFRSQRQIIIDSEKLLREKTVIAGAEFNARSNTLGHDQKVLRLKYGEFLGEEFESAIGAGDELPTDDHNAEADTDPAKQYSHIHDKDNEHNLVPDEQSRPDDHDHDAGADPDRVKDPTEAYKHVHDDPEEATFFTQAIRAKLKAALSVMWDAELHLRLSDPATSLPYQYRALRLLKEISNDSRIYVHKTGFDAPPLKEDKRLTGDLSEISTARHEAHAVTTQTLPAIRMALRTIEHELDQPGYALSGDDKNILSRAGQELAKLALEHPGRYLQALSAINALTGDPADVPRTDAFLMTVRTALWQALPAERTLPGQLRHTPHTLDRKFIENLEALKNE